MPLHPLTPDEVQSEIERIEQTKADAKTKIHKADGDKLKADTGKTNTILELMLKAVAKALTEGRA